MFCFARLLFVTKKNKEVNENESGGGGEGDGCLIGAGRGCWEKVKERKKKGEVRATARRRIEGEKI